MDTLTISLTVVGFILSVYPLTTSIASFVDDLCDVPGEIEVLKVEVCRRRLIYLELAASPVAHRYVGVHREALRAAISDIKRILEEGEGILIRLLQENPDRDYNGRSVLRRFAWPRLGWIRTRRRIQRLRSAWQSAVSDVGWILHMCQYQR